VDGGAAHGLLVQPLIGYYSDRTWNWLGAGGRISSRARCWLDCARRDAAFADACGWRRACCGVLDASINIAMEPFRAFVADQLPPSQRPAGYSMQSFFIGVGAVVASMLPWILAHAASAMWAPRTILSPTR
jgi:maltose/moltooligosaccharide transporter